MRASGWPICRGGRRRARPARRLGRRRGGRQRQRRRVPDRSRERPRRRRSGRPLRPSRRTPRSAIRPSSCWIRACDLGDQPRVGRHQHELAVGRARGLEIAEPPLALRDVDQKSGKRHRRVARLVLRQRLGVAAGAVLNLGLRRTGAALRARPGSAPRAPGRLRSPAAARRRPRRAASRPPVTAPPATPPPRTDRRRGRGQCVPCPTSARGAPASPPGPRGGAAAGRAADPAAPDGAGSPSSARRRRDGRRRRGRRAGSPPASARPRRAHHQEHHSVAVPTVAAAQESQPGRRRDAAPVLPMEMLDSSASADGPPRPAWARSARTPLDVSAEQAASSSAVSVLARNLPRGQLGSRTARCSRSGSARVW